MKKTRKIIIALALVVSMMMGLTCVSAFAEGESDTITVYFQNNWCWSDVRCHYWGSESGDSQWPGAPMTVIDNDGTYDIYSVEIPADVTGILFDGIKDDGSGALDQSPDITEGIVDGAGWCMAWDQNNLAVPYEYEGAVVNEPRTDPYVFFKNDAGWENVYYHAFSMTDGSEAEWPGLPMTILEGGYYFAYVPTQYTHIIFHNGAVDTPEFVQTNNLRIPTNGNTLYSIETGKWSAAPDIEIPGAPEGDYGTPGNGESAGQKKPGFFQKIWIGITNFFKGIGNFFKNIFGGKKK